MVDVFDILKEGAGIDMGKLVDYARKCESEAVERRLGYLLDLIGVKHDVRPGNRTSYKLNPGIKEKGVFNNKWRIYVNEVLQ